MKKVHFYRGSVCSVSRMLFIRHEKNPFAALLGIGCVIAFSGKFIFAAAVRTDTAGFRFHCHNGPNRHNGHNGLQTYYHNCHYCHNGHNGHNGHDGVTGIMGIVDIRCLRAAAPTLGYRPCMCAPSPTLRYTLCICVRLHPQ